MLPVVIIAVFCVVAVVVTEIRRGAQLRNGVRKGDSEIPLEVMDSTSHDSKRADHHQTDAAHGHGHPETPDVTHHDSGSFHDSAGHSGFDGGAFHGGHH